MKSHVSRRLLGFNLYGSYTVCPYYSLYQLFNRWWGTSNFKAIHSITVVISLCGPTEIAMHGWKTHHCTISYSMCVSSFSYLDTEPPNYFNTHLHHESTLQGHRPGRRMILCVHAWREDLWQLKLDNGTNEISSSSISNLILEADRLWFKKTPTVIIAFATTFRNVSICSHESHGPHLHLFKAIFYIIKAVKASSTVLHNSQLAHNEWTNSQSPAKSQG